MSEQRPLDVLETALGAAVTVRLKGGEQIVGELVGFDQHMNLVVEPAATGEDSGQDAAASATSASQGVDNTTVIRGDNLVSIEL